MPLSADEKERIMQSRQAEKSASRMIQLKPIIDGTESIMLTGNSIEEAFRSCQDRFTHRFEGFAPIPVEIVARSKWGEYQDRKVSRAELEEWLKLQDDEKEIRALFNQMRG